MKEQEIMKKSSPDVDQNVNQEIVIHENVSLRFLPISQCPSETLSVKCSDEIMNFGPPPWSSG